MVMEMKSTRRSFDRSREPVLKKPRLADEPPNPNGRPFPQRPAAAQSLPPAGRYRVSTDRDSENNDSSRPQPPQFHELVSKYKTALAELTFNSKPIITNLTIIAGEILHVAKAIAATVCSNILEVPSDQKLPSLYLLDSIVKNIGRDYIKYFAATLPEVFCKAYRQVDPPVHQSMRHLFGTWKGVFPPQSLQMIEQELGFTPAVTGSSSGAAMSRPESQLRRPQHSIHVNPKYLEIQRFQQSSRAKGMGNELTVPVANSTEDVERPERAAGIVAGLPWTDPPLKMHNIQRSHRETLSEVVHEKKIPAVYGDPEYSSDIPRNSGLGIGRTGGRVADQEHEKPWYGAGNSVEPISGQRNGFGMKHGVPNYLTSKSSNADLHLPSTQSIISKSNSAVSSSWKNSEEEEFMWGMHSWLLDQDAANMSISSRKESWTNDGLEKLELDNKLRKSQTGHEVASRFERETSSDSLSMEQKSFGHSLSSPWLLKELHPTDGLIPSGTSTINTSNTEGYFVTAGGLPTGVSSSSSRMTVRPHMGTSGSALIADTYSGSSETLGQQRFQPLGVVSSPSGQSPMRQQPPSPSFPARYPNQQLENSSDVDLPQSLSQTQPDYKGHQLPRNLVNSNIQLGDLQKLQSEEFPSSFPALPFPVGRQDPFSQPRLAESKQYVPSAQLQKPHLASLSKIGSASALVSSALDRSTPSIVETSQQSSTSSLLAAVMKSGILGNITTSGLPGRSFQDDGQMPSESSIQPPLPSGPPPKVSSSTNGVTSASSPVSEDDTSASSTVSHKKEGQPPLPPGRPPSSVHTSNAADKASNPLSNLLSSLVSKGLISASNSKSSSSLSTQIPIDSKVQNPRSPTPTPSPSLSLPVSSAFSHPSTRGNLSLPKADSKDTSAKIKSPTGFDSKDTIAVPQHTSAEKKSLMGSDSKDTVTSTEIKSLIALQFKSDVIRELHPHVINALFDDLVHQCSICGLRVKLKERLDRHMEWHTWRKPGPDGTNWVTRRWYADSEDWVAGKAGFPFDVESSVLVDDDEPVVLADENQCACVLCGELFEDYYSQKKKKWMFKAAVHLAISSSDGDIGSMDQNVEGPIVHVNCISESSIRDLGLASGDEIDKDE